MGSAVTVNAEGAEPFVGLTRSQVAFGKVVKGPEPVTFSVCVTAGPPDCAEKLSGFLSTPSVVWAGSATDAQKSTIVGVSSLFKESLLRTRTIGYERSGFGRS